MVIKESRGGRFHRNQEKRDMSVFKITGMTFRKGSASFLVRFFSFRSWELFRFLENIKEFERWTELKTRVTAKPVLPKMHEDFYDIKYLSLIINACVYVSTWWVLTRPHVSSLDCSVCEIRSITHFFFCRMVRKASKSHENSTGQRKCYCFHVPSCSDLKTFFLYVDTLTHVQAEKCDLFIEKDKKRFQSPDIQEGSMWNCAGKDLGLTTSK